MANTPEIMSDFFDIRADGYDDHMKANVENYEEFYTAVTEPIESSEEELKILDIGCGTGLELDGIFAKLPKSIVTCNDLSQNMLQKLKIKYKENSSRINLLIGNYTELEFPENHFDYVISVMTVHHLLPKPKTALYKKIRSCLKEGGVYIEGDFVVNEKMQKEYRDYYEEKIQSLENENNGKYHLDLPFTVEKQLKLFRAAGFSEVDVYWEKASAAVFVCRK